MILKLTKEPKQQSSSIPPFLFFFLLDVNPNTHARVPQNGMDLNEVLFTRERYGCFWVRFVTGSRFRGVQFLDRI